MSMTIRASTDRRPRRRPRAGRIVAIAAGLIAITALLGFGLVTAAGGGSQAARAIGYSRTAEGAAVAGVTRVGMQDHAFAPAVIQVSVGTTVTWTNDDREGHTVTFKEGRPGSPLLTRGQTFSHDFATPGTFDYFCAPHLSMVGRVVVTP